MRGDAAAIDGELRLDVGDEFGFGVVGKSDEDELDGAALAFGGPVSGVAVFEFQGGGNGLEGAETLAWFESGLV